MNDAITFLTGTMSIVLAGILWLAASALVNSMFRGIMSPTSDAEKDLYAFSTRMYYWMYAAAVFALGWCLVALTLAVPLVFSNPPR